MTIRVVCMTVFLKKEAIERVYPGGAAAFLRSRPDCLEDLDLVGTAFMAGAEVEQFLDTLAAIGFVPGRDVGVGDRFIGEILRCEGIAYEQDPAEPFGPWHALAVARDRLMP